MKTVKTIIAAVLIALASASCGLGNSGQSGPPAPCVRALELADEGFRANSAGFEGVSDLFSAQTATEVEIARSKIDTAAKELNRITPEYQKQKDLCRNFGQK
jgi:hypothetical protein